MQHFSVKCERCQSVDIVFGQVRCSNVEILVGNVGDYDFESRVVTLNICLNCGLSTSQYFGGAPIPNTLQSNNKHEESTDEKSPQKECENSSEKLYIHDYDEIRGLYCEDDSGYDLILREGCNNTVEAIGRYNDARLSSLHTEDKAVARKMGFVVR